MEKNKRLEKDLYNTSSFIRTEVARQKYRLDILVNDPHWTVRKEVARQGYGLDILVNDTDIEVRQEVAGHGYGLNILVNDRDFTVRQEVARQGYGLDILVNDPSWVVRCEVAKQGYGLDILVNDEEWEVRKEVAFHLYGLDILIKDNDHIVKEIAKKLMNYKVIILKNNWGTYRGNLYIYIHKKENKYLIRSGCYESDNLIEWSKKCYVQLGENVFKEVTQEIRDLLIKNNITL